jgi:hypothetical protein
MVTCENTRLAARLAQEMTQEMPQEIVQEMVPGTADTAPSPMRRRGTVTA